MICVRWYLITLSAITIAGVVTVPVAASARNNLKIRISLRRVSILRGEDQSPLFACAVSLITSVLFGLTMAFFYLWLRRVHKLPDWKDL
ncbi:DUF6404 family protein (plasmid) [Klebsiella pneumoniae]